MNEGILIQDSDHKEDPAEADDVTATGYVDQPGTSEEDKKILRDQLRKTLNQSKSGTHESLTSSGNVNTIARFSCIMNVIVVAPYQPRSYFVLTDAGKPVFTRAVGQDSDDIASMIAVMQALISVFLDDHDKLRSINAGKTRITFLTRSPLYYVCVSSWGEPESVTRSHLEYLHLQILSVVTAGQLRRIFERRTNFDLRRLLNGAESFLSSLLDRAELDLAMSTSALHCLKLEPPLRKRVAEALVPHSKIKDMLYVMLIASGQVVALIRPRRHSIHPADVHIILNTVQSPSIFNSPAPASWIPICLPKYNPQCFVHAYISFLRRREVHGPPDRPPTPVPECDVPEETVGPNFNANNYAVTCNEDLQSPSLLLVCISTGLDMDVVRGWCDSATQKLEGDGLLAEIIDACRSRNTVYSVSDLCIPGLRHFVYKSRAHVQITMPIFEEPYDDITARRRLITLYQMIHDSIHAKSGQEGTLKLQYLRTEKESLLGWITQPFEIYLSLSQWLPKTAAINAANAVARWIKKEEGRIFLYDAPVF
ncbi:trafficking protein Mon1-domain-containing protein [Amanita rubescens]|nr:trafficking protein Mon1-domain-containing protein [Amanita rubescens]